MKQKIFIALAILLIISLNANAISLAIKKKYPYPLLTDDYGILNENDIAAYTWGLKPRPFNPDKISGQYTYWQCFPRDHIYLTLEDEGSSSEDFGWRDNVGNLEINVWITPTLVHRYDMRTKWTVSDYQKRFNKWRELMKNEKYVCLAGSSVLREKKIEDGKTKEIYSWVFEKIKTKKGCDSYFDTCHPTYQAYLKEQAKIH